MFLNFEWAGADLLAIFGYWFIKANIYVIYAISNICSENDLILCQKIVFGNKNPTT